MKIDLNCDMGEAFGAWQMGQDAVLMEYITSANIACGFHAGDASIMRRTVELAIEKGVKIGAHPSFPDLQGFGRRNMSLSPSEVYDICVYQIGALLGFVRSFGVSMHHVKPHGALYNMAAQDPKLAKAIAEAVKAVQPNLILYGLAGSCLISEARKVGLKTASEVFADRTYQNDGSLTPRSQPDALIENTQIAVNQVVKMIKEGIVIATDGTPVTIQADTVCVHGDGLHAVEFVKMLQKSLN
jgi:5-oxoprolinase (ATP-hydrolysing) subunit A